MSCAVVEFPTDHSVSECNIRRLLLFITQKQKFNPSECFWVKVHLLPTEQVVIY